MNDFSRQTTEQFCTRGRLRSLTHDRQHEEPVPMNLLALLTFLFALPPTAKAPPYALRPAEVERIIQTIPPRPNATRKNIEPRDVDEWFKSLTPKQRRAISLYCNSEERAYEPVCGGTPLVADFDQSPIQFGHLGAFPFSPGLPTTTLWPSTATPWIARDLDGSGCIETGAELLGSNTLLPNGTLASNGFEALAALDANHDRIVDSKDPAYSTLVLWANGGDRICRPSELRRLSDSIISISLQPTKGTKRGEMLQADMTWRDMNGVHHGRVVDIFLADQAGRPNGTAYIASPRPPVL
jgi:hypothetical protein